MEKDLLEQSFTDWRVKIRRWVGVLSDIERGCGRFALRMALTATWRTMRYFPSGKSDDFGIISGSSGNRNENEVVAHNFALIGT